MVKENKMPNMDNFTELEDGKESEIKTDIDPIVEIKDKEKDNQLPPMNGDGDDFKGIFKPKEPDKTVEEIAAEKKLADDKIIEDKKIADDNIAKEKTLKEDFEKYKTSNPGKKEEELKVEFDKIQLEKENEFKLEDEIKKIDISPDNIVPSFSLEDAAKDLEIELGEKKDKVEFIAAVKAKIEAAKEIKQLDLSKYDDETKQVINLLEKGITIKDIIEPLKRYDNFISLSKEEKISEIWKADGKTDKQIQEDLKDEDVAEKELREYYREIEGKSKAQITEIIEDLVSEEKLLDTHKDLLSKQYTSEIKTIREEKYKEILADSEKKILSLQSKDKLESQEEKKNLITTLNNTKEYKGLKLPTEVLKDIESKIENGEFFKTLDNASAQINAYLDLRFRDQIDKAYEKRITEVTRLSYNKGTDKVKAKLHNSPQIDSVTHHDQNDNRPGLEKAAGKMEDGAL